jgi:hypothetical protein
MIALALVCVALIALNVVQYVYAQKEREKLVRRIAEPRQVMVQEAPKREPPERVWTDEQFRRLMLSRGQIPRDS